MNAGRLGWLGVRLYGFGYWARVLMLAVFVAPLGCATPGDGGSKVVAPEAQRAAVIERVNARWAALLKGDFDAAYLYLSPASREVVTLAEFKARVQRVGLREMAVDSVECEAELCKVRLFLTYDHRLMKGIRTPISESWVIDKNQAWYVWPL